MKMKHVAAILIMIVLLTASSHATAAEVAVIINYPSISPNGDGERDSSLVRITLSETFDSLTATLRDEFEIEILDTLISKTSPDSGSYSAFWTGRDSLGNILSDDSYILRIRAVHPDTTIDLSRTLIVDTSPPLIHIDMIEPGIYSPAGLEGEVLVYYTVSQFDEGSEVTAMITDPGGDTTQTSLEVGGEGSYIMEWTPSNPASGVYTIALSISDLARNSSSDQGQVEVDADPPEIIFFTSIPLNTTEAPSSISGSCYDPSSVDSLVFLWNEVDEIFPSGIHTSNDTVYWTVEILDSVYTGGGFIEGTYSLEARARDPFGQEESAKISFKIDLTPPSAPVLADPPSTVMVPELTVSYGYELEIDADSVIFYRLHEGDTTTTLASASNPHPKVQLEEGDNEIWAVAVDRAGNQSLPSNHVLVSYDTSARSEFPEAWRGPDKFRISTSRTATKVTAEIFDLSGEKVVKLVEFGPSDYFEIGWDLSNADGEEVRNGAYLVIITKYYVNGKNSDKHFIAVVR